MKGWSWKTWLYYYYRWVWFRVYAWPRMIARSQIICVLGRFFAKHEEFIDYCKDFYWSQYTDSLFEE